MKRNISVFIILILLASSFKYRTKAKESGQPSFITAGFDSKPAVQVEVAPSLDKVIEQMQQANLDKVNGNSESIKALWSHSDSVTIFDGKENLELKGWNAVQAELDKGDHAGNDYTYKTEEIASHQSGDQACILQKEYYSPKKGKPVNLYATIIFRKENNAWKIVHRQEDSLAPVAQSDKSSK